jgi:glutamate synthase (NADPH) small chain
VGAGGAGLGCALTLLQQGYRVTLFDAREELGGVATETIPVRRLAQDVVPAEMTAILDTVPSERLEWRYGVRMGAGLTVDDLLAGDFAAVFIGVGLGETAGLPGAKRLASGVVEVLAFLREMKASPDTHVPRSVAVLGGGNSAMDAAVTAKRAGAEDVYLIYRRSFAEMPAWPTERDEAVSAGVHFIILTQPVDYATDEEGLLRGVQVVSTRLGKADNSGRRQPEPIAGTERVIEAGLVIEALGQRAAADLDEWVGGVELTEEGLIAVTDEMETSRPGVFAGGDIVNGGATVVQAVAEGVKAAKGIAAYLEQ